SIALEREGALVAGLVYNPISEDMFTAEKGSGGFLNGKRLRVAPRKEMSPALFAPRPPFLGRPGHAPALAQARAVMAGPAGAPRRFGAAALDMAWTAAGRIDGFWEHGINLWDTAAGIVLVREAGGIVSDFAGRTDGLAGDDIVCANEHLHPQLLKLLKGVKAD